MATSFGNSIDLSEEILDLDSDSVSSEKTIASTDANGNRVASDGAIESKPSTDAVSLMTSPTLATIPSVYCASNAGDTEDNVDVCLELESANDFKVSAENQTETEFTLNDFPVEILLAIMMNLRAGNLLALANVCERFQAIAKCAFRKIYCATGQHFKVDGECLNDVKRLEYTRFFNIFGEDIGAIEICFNRRDPRDNDWIINNIRHSCKSLTHAQVECGTFDLTTFLCDLPELTHLELWCIRFRNPSWAMHRYPKLVSFRTNDWLCLTNQEFLAFINSNSQLETLKMWCPDYNLNVMNGKLPRLKNLCLEYEYGVFPTKPIIPNSIEISNLETFELSGLWSYEECVNILNAMIPSTKITKIILSADWNDADWNDDIIDALKKHRHLKYLTIREARLYLHIGQDITLNYLNRIIMQLPNLMEIECDRLRGFVVTGIDIATALMNSKLMGSKLRHLSIGMSTLSGLNHEVIIDIAQTTQYNPNLKVTLSIESHNKLTSYQGEVRYNNSILYWNGFDPMCNHSEVNFLDVLNEKDKIAQKIIDYLDVNDLSALLDTCTQTKQLVEQYLCKNTLRLSIRPANFDKTALIRLGKYIRFVEVWENSDNSHSFRLNAHSLTKYEDDVLGFWQDLNKYYCVNLAELTVEWIEARSMDRLTWPNLTKIKIAMCNEESYENVREFICPKLTQLEIGPILLRNVHPKGALDDGNSFRQLTAMAVMDVTDEKVRSLLQHGLGQDICLQIQELSFGKSMNEYFEAGWNQQDVWQMIEILTRFKNATTSKRLLLECVNLLED